MVNKILRWKYSAFKVLSFFFLLAMTADVRAQLIVTPGVTSASLINNLVGSSMTITNVTLNCPNNAYGNFSNGNTTNMGISTGILLTTGSAIGAIGPNNSTSYGTCNNTNLNDPQLQSLDPQATRDPCILEFDIVPQCNTLTVRFVFGSEEYPEWVNSSFNDAFGFWITGPGPACQPGYYNNTNVATLPNGTQVSIDNVNPFTNSAYYVNNNNGATIQYDGMTTVVTRTVLLCACQTYHWKIAIADAGDCVYDSGVFIDFLQCSTALTATAISTPASCAGCNGTATVNPTGTGPFTYSWAPSGGNAQTATGLCPGTYTCTVDDNVSCSPPTVVAVSVGTNTVTVTSAITPGNVTCNAACNGTATANPTSGNAPYSYSWSPSGGNAQTATGLCPGNYTVSITDANSCTGTQTVIITEPPVLTAASSGTNITCFGGTDGTATANPSGGSGGYTFSWAPSGGNAATANGLSAGSYTCTVADLYGCATTTSVTLTEPTAVAPTSSGTTISCFAGADGTATAIGAGGSGGYSYSWLPFGGNAATANGLSAGSYTCIVTDISGCTGSTSLTLTEPTAMALAASSSPALCLNACDGQTAVVANGGTPFYLYSWNTGCNTANCPNICAGSYTVTVTDANGCSTTATTTVTQPTVITQNLSSLPAHCNAADGTASTVANGGTGPYTYNWMPGNGNTATYTNVGFGQYTVTVTDANGCTSVDSVQVPNAAGLTIASPPVTNVSCFSACDASITATGNAATPPFTYSWSPSGGNASTASNLCPGAYTVTVTDANGCWNTASFTVTEPALLTAATTATPPVICDGATTNLSGSGAGGTVAYNYNWMPGNLAGNTPAVSPNTTTTYTLTVTDANGCTATATEIVTVNPTPVAAFSGAPLAGCSPLDISFTDVSAIAAPGTITAWLWEFGDNTTDTLQDPLHTYYNPMSYGVTLTVVTADGCTSTLTINNYITVYPDPVAGFSAFPQPATAIEPIIYFTDESSGATAWEWNFGDVPNSSSSLQNPVFEYPDSGCYYVQQIVTSPNNCRDTTETLVCIQPDWSLYIPNAFTPDKDGLNDIFLPLGVGIDNTGFEMWIFDRWGNLIFYTNDMYHGWDGKAKGGSEFAQVDTYVYKIKCKDVVGAAHKYIGKVSLVR
ncbi:hypothetical protein BH11BAC7_BH11BAC7_06550 [soil metagenome]